MALEKKHRARLLKRLIEHPRLYLESWKRDTDEVLASANHFTLRNAKDFSKALRSQETTSGYLSVLVASRRSTTLCYEGVRQVLNEQQAGWALFDRAYDNLWWAFRTRPYSFGNYESQIQLMLCHSALLGYQARSDFLGRYFYERREGENAERYLQYSDVGRFVAQLWATANGLPLEKFGDYREFTEPDTGYAFVLDNLFDEDPNKLTSALEQVLDFHLQSANNEEGIMRTAILFHLLPVEVFYVVYIREQRGIKTNLPEHELLSTSVARIEDAIKFTGTLPDPVLEQALEKAIKQSFISQIDLDTYRNRVAT
jgi:hypothetical protein